jgi:hypothetical protein
MLKPANNDPNKNAADRRFIEHPEEFGGFNVLQTQARIATNTNDSANVVKRRGRPPKTEVVITE